MVRRIDDSKSGTNVGSGSRAIHTIHDVQSFQPELHLHALGEIDVFHKREIDVVPNVTPNVRKAERQRAEVADTRRYVRESCGVKPTIYCRVVDRNIATEVIDVVAGISISITREAIGSEA